MKLLAGILSAGVLALATPPARAEWAPAADFEARLHAEIASGGLDQATAGLYRLYAVTAAHRLPSSLRVETGDEGWGRRTSNEVFLHRCGTPILRMAKAQLASAPPHVRAELESLLHPAQPPSTRSAERIAGKTVTHALANWVLTENFSIEWGPALTNEDGTTPPRDSDGDGVPDVVEAWASLFEASFAGDLAALGLSAGSPAVANTAVATNLIPIYIGNSDQNSSIENISRGTYAFTREDLPTPHIVVNNNLTFVPSNQDPEGRIRGAMKITASHEFFHVLHFLWQPAAWQPIPDDWWLEASSTWIEDEVFDIVDDYLQYLDPDGSSWPDFVEDGLPVLFSDPNYVARAYGSVIFAKYLSEHVSGQASMSEIWDVIRGPPGARILDALNQYASGQGFTGALGELFLGFAATNATMDYEDGSDYKPVPIRKSSLDADSAADTLEVPRYLGATYLQGNRGPAPAVQVSLSGGSQPAQAIWGLALAAKRAAGYSLALTALAPAGSTAVQVASVGALDDIYAAPAFLSASASSLSYRTVESNPVPADTVPPGTPSAVTVLAVPGGFDAVWSPPPEPDIEGYVVRWKPQSLSAFQSRTVLSPTTGIEIRGLPAGPTYDVQVLAYDSSANAGSASSSSIQVVEAQSDAPIPPADDVIVEVSIGNPPPSGDGGGGGGGGCFVRSLHR